MIKRTEYLDKLYSWKDEKVIKVVTGIRRCGKSTLFEQFQEELIANGVLKNQIISINFEDLDNEHLLDYKALYDYVNEKLVKGKTTYIFLDEIQNVASFEKAVDALYIKDNTDIYITGSNSYMLSGELATLLTGRYVELSILPLSFKEFCSAFDDREDKAFADYLKYGGFPYLTTMKDIDNKYSDYIEGIYNTVIINDIEGRQKRRTKNSDIKRVDDIVLLKVIAKYLSSVVGSLVSVKSVTDYLKSNGRKVSHTTVDNYMEALSEAYVFYPVSRFDIVGKEILKSNKKWYVIDLGIRNHILPKKNYDLGFSLENVVFFELLRRGYKVNIGKYNNREVDFVCQKNDELFYFQVTADLTNQATFDRKIAPFKSIDDNYEKTILTLDRFTTGNYDGIKVANIIDWLLDK